MLRSEGIQEVSSVGWSRGRLDLDEETLDAARALVDWGMTDPHTGERNARLRNENSFVVESDLVHRFAVLEALEKKIGPALSVLESGALRFRSVCLVHTRAEHVRKDDLPFLPHIDRHRYIKAMLYIDDVEAMDGPLTLGHGAPRRKEGIRRALPADYQARKLNVIRAAMEYTPIVGPAGTLTIFDTNCPHHAGIVRDQGSRRVLRFQYSTDAWESMLRAQLARSATLR